MRRSEGIVDYLSGRPGELAVRVATVSSRGGSIESAYVRIRGGQAYVCGQVSRGLGVEPDPGAHIDITVLNNKAEILESHSEDYLPRSIPPPLRRVSYSRYTARLVAIPAASDLVQVVFHNRPRESAAPCQRNHGPRSCIVRAPSRPADLLLAAE